MGLEPQEIATADQANKVGESGLARIVIHGTIAVSGDDLVIDLRAWDLEENKEILSRRYKGSLADPFVVQEAVAGDMAAAAKAHVSDQERQRLATAPTDKRKVVEQLFRAIEALYAGLYERGLKHCEEAIQMDGKCAEAYLAKGTLRMLHDADSTCLASLTQAISLNPACYETGCCYACARLYVESNLPAALAESQRLQQLNSSRPEAYFIQAAALMSLCPSEAMKAIDRALQLDPYNSAYHAMRGVIVVTANVTGKMPLAEARRELEVAREIDAECYIAMQLESLLSLVEHRYERAVECLTRAEHTVATTDPAMQGMTYLIHRSLGETYCAWAAQCLEDKDVEQAYAKVELCIYYYLMGYTPRLQEMLPPQSPGVRAPEIMRPMIFYKDDPARFLMAIANVARKHTEVAAEAESYGLMTKALADLTQLAACAENIEAIRARAPDRRVVLFCLSVLYSGQLQLRAGDVKEAGRKVDAIYLSLTRMEPNNWMLLSEYGTVLQSQGRTGEARDMINQSLAANPYNAFGYVTRGRLELKEGMRKEALASFQKAITLEPSSVGYVGLVSYYRNTGDSEQALKAALNGINEAHAKGDKSVVVAQLHGAAAELYAGKDDWAEVKAHVEAAVALCPALGAHPSIVQLRQSLNRHGM